MLTLKSKAVLASPMPVRNPLTRVSRFTGILLVSSAFHGPRALAPVPCWDYSSIRLPSFLGGWPLLVGGAHARQLPCWWKPCRSAPAGSLRPDQRTCPPQRPTNWEQGHVVALSAYRRPRAAWQRPRHSASAGTARWLSMYPERSLRWMTQGTSMMVCTVAST